MVVEVAVAVAIVVVAMVVMLVVVAIYMIKLLRVASARNSHESHLPPTSYLLGSCP